MRSEFVSLALVLALGCGPEPVPTDPALAAKPVLDSLPTVHVAGCDHFEAARCIMQARGRAEVPVLVWVDMDMSARIELRVDGVPLPCTRVEADGGQRLEAMLSPGAGQVEVVGVDPRWSQPHSIGLEWESVPEVVVEASQATAATDELIARLEVAADEHRGVERLAVLQRLHRMLEARGHVDQAVVAAEQAVAVAKRLGRDRELASAASALAFRYQQRGDIVSARRWVEAVEGAAGTVPEARGWASYYRGVVAMAANDPVGAARSMADAHRHGERLGAVDFLLGAVEQHAVALGELGRLDEARSIVGRGTELVRDIELPCPVRARALGNFGWAQLRLIQAGHDLEPVREMFEQSLYAWEHTCLSAQEAASQRINLALVALAEGEPGEAKRWLDPLDVPYLPRGLRLWVAEIEARVGMASGRWEMMPSVMLRPVASGELGLDFSGQVRRARTLSELGLTTAAIDGFSSAEQMLERATASVGIAMGQEMFLAQRSASAQGLVRSLVQAGKPAAALCRARLARGRVLRGIDRTARIAGLSAARRTAWESATTALLATRAELAREAQGDWERSGAELVRRRARRAVRRAEADAELEQALAAISVVSGSVDCARLAPVPPTEVLVLVAADDQGTLVFVADADRVQVVQGPVIGSVEPSTWAAVALGPVAERLGDASRIRVIAEDLGPEHALARLPVGGRALLELAPIVHTLDLPPRPSSPPAPVQALVVADPSEDLPLARREGAAVHGALVDAGWTSALYVGPHADRGAVLGALGTAELFHYAGHGVQRGVAGWDAALRLSDGELGVTELLATARVPSRVVLAGCETGSRSEGAWAGGLNLGRAFVLAGSAQVIVTDGRIDDAFALRVAEALARRLASAPDLAIALHHTRVELRQQDPAAPWWRLRVLVP